jgi:ABC-type multidrug transport system fused ATPase/permease subunit
MYWLHCGPKHDFMKTYWRLLQYLRPHVPAAMLVVLLALMSVVAQGVAVWIGADFLHQFILGSQESARTLNGTSMLRPLDDLARAVLEQATPFGTIVAAALSLIGVRLAVGLLQVLRFVVVARVSQSVLAKIRDTLFDRMTRLDLSFSRRTRPGEVATVFLRDVDQLNEAIFDTMERAVMQPARLLAVVAIMLSQSWLLTLWMVVFLGAGAVAVRFGGSLIEKRCKITLQRITQLQGSLVEYLSTALLARLLNRESFERRRFADINNDIRGDLVRIMFLRNLAPVVVAFLFALAGGGILILGGYQVFVEETLSATTLLKLIMLLALAAVSVEKLAVMYATLRVSLVSARRVFDLMDLPPPPPDPPDAIAVGRLEKSIVMKDVSYQVDGHTILQSLNLCIGYGQRVIVYGPSGSGKSTLLGLLAGVLQCSQGRIEVDGVPMTHIRRHSWRQKLGFVFQESLLLNGTVRDNLKYACPTASEDDLLKVLAQVRLDTDPRVSVAWLDRQVGHRGENLSGGERQRVAIARALLTDPEILLLDEPTSMLDAVSKQQVFDTIRSASEKRTVILVTHDPILRELADLEVHLSEGRIVEPRTPVQPGGPQPVSASDTEGSG